MKKYKRMFVDEAREHLSLAGQHLVNLEKSPRDKALINDLFRNAHSIKGMAASLGYDEIGELSHAMEDLLDLYRIGQRIFDPPVIDLFLRAVDFLEQMVDEVDGDSPLSAAGELVEEIKNQLGGKNQDSVRTGGAAEESREQPASDVPLEGGKAASAGSGRLHVVFRVSADSVSPGARGFMAVKKLNALGSLARTRPDIETIKNGRYGRVVDADLETDLRPEEVTRALAELTEIIDVRVEYASTHSALSLSAPKGSREASAPAPAPSPKGQSRTVRVKTETLDRFVDAVGELILNKSELREIARDLDSDALLQGLSRLEVSLEELKRQAMSVRLTPLDRVLGTFPRLVRDLSRSRQKEVRLEIRGADLELDRALVDALNEALIHLVRNAIDHGLEGPDERTGAGKEREGRLLIEAYREKDVAVIHVEDDGRGVDVAKVRETAVSRKIISAEDAGSVDEETAMNLLFLPGMSTAQKVSEISGRGVGLDAVRMAVQGMGGSVGLRSRPGGGTQFTLRIPFSAAILRALIVRVGEEVYAVPIPKLHRAFEVAEQDLLNGPSRQGQTCFCRIEDDLLPTRPLSALLGLPGKGGEDSGQPGSRSVIVADTLLGRTALLVDDLLGEEEVFVKPLGRPLSKLESLSGITVLGNGRPVFVLDPYGLNAAIPSDEPNTDGASGENDP